MRAQSSVCCGIIIPNFAVGSRKCRKPEEIHVLWNTLISEGARCLSHCAWCYVKTITGCCWSFNRSQCVKHKVRTALISSSKSLPKAIYSTDHYQTQRTWVLWLQKNIFTSLEHSYKMLHCTKDGQQWFTLIPSVHIWPFSGRYLVPFFLLNDSKDVKYISALCRSWWQNITYDIAWSVLVNFNLHGESLSLVKFNTSPNNKMTKRQRLSKLGNLPEIKSD